MKQNIAVGTIDHPPGLDEIAPIQIRTMVANDAQAVAQLCPALGYEVTQQQVECRLALAQNRPDNGFFVAQQGAVIVAWAHVIGVRSLATDGYAEIAGVVVEPERERLGIGTGLIRACEAWAKVLGYSEVRLRSGTQREEAHAFYRAIGYDSARASLLFRRRLGVGGTEPTQPVAASVLATVIDTLP